ncbi:Dephospho-CoA kinase [Tenacibaculum sp. 190524A02b]|uniref:Dephospho-CoA kinase n=1 Tax=Tenacibaculum vairaonense TaxID=3137860 RepID=A0ABP1FGP9_9FLAO
MVIGLTGGIGSGKSTVAKMFLNFENIAYYNADEEAKNLMNNSLKIKENLIKEFGNESYLNNSLNRPYIANIVFNDKKKLAILNNIVHPVVYEHLNNFIFKNKDKNYILYENAILFENGSNSFCDKIITVSAPIALRIERVIKRDHSNYNDVKKRMNNQWRDEKKIMQSNYIINNIDINLTKNNVKQIHHFLTKNKH